MEYESKHGPLSRVERMELFVGHREPPFHGVGSQSNYQVHFVNGICLQKEKKILSYKSEEHKQWRECFMTAAHWVCGAGQVYWSPCGKTAV
jgi:hypothetical protein